MNSFFGRFQNFLQRLNMAMRRLMAGRYGTDRLNLVILCAGLVFSLISSILRGGLFGLLAWAVSYALMIWAICRSLSKNIHKRYEENRRFMIMVNRVKDRHNRYFLCPRCRQTVRVPRGKGKIAITCPKCRERFERRT